MDSRRGEEKLSSLLGRLRGSTGYGRNYLKGINSSHRGCLGKERVRLISKGKMLGSFQPTVWSRKKIKNLSYALGVGSMYSWGSLGEEGITVTTSMRIEGESRTCGTPRPSGLLFFIKKCREKKTDLGRRNRVSFIPPSVFGLKIKIKIKKSSNVSRQLRGRPSILEAQSFIGDREVSCVYRDHGGGSTFYTLPFWGKRREGKWAALSKGIRNPHILFFSKNSLKKNTSNHRRGSCMSRKGL